ncbi:Hypothetical predicted protein [Cloeon dipterum]|uniref:C2H2-type domain-containing protein n=1 Tax=Cloeon dipterum TaxID=197152 RepID=A0A8S1DHI5_9INSE|nr:Hypothetical predicted protein [Cloeon dipterum]
MKLNADFLDKTEQPESASSDQLIHSVFLTPDLEEISINQGPFCSLFKPSRETMQDKQCYFDSPSYVESNTLEPLCEIGQNSHHALQETDTDVQDLIVFPCKLCNQFFVSEFALQSHMNEAHPGR